MRARERAKATSEVEGGLEVRAVVEVMGVV